MAATYGKARWPRGYLASVLARIKENKAVYGGSFSKATWRVCFFQEAKKNTIVARRIEKAVLDHKKREERKPLTWQEKLEKTIGRPFAYILNDAKEHERRFFPADAD